MRRLLPDPVATISALEAYAAERPRPGGRPWMAVCMVSSLDGSTAVDGRSRGLGSSVDTDVLLTLRRLADLIVVGASTVRHEHYGPPSKPGQRIGVVSRHGRLDFNTPLFTSGAGFVIAPEDCPELPVETLRAGKGDVDLAAVMAQLDAGHVHVEGGPTLNGALAAADLIDELDLTVSPHLVGGQGRRLVTGAPELVQRLRLAHVLEADDFLFLRYVR